MTLPAQYDWPTKERFLADPLRVLGDLYAEVAGEVNRPGWRLEGTVAVSAGLSTVDVAASIDRLPIQVFIEPDWLTTHRVTAKAVTGFTVDFGTAAPGGGGTIDYLVIQAEAGP